MQMSTMDTETGEMIVKRVSVPIGLEELMEGLTKEILLKKPDDIYLFAAEYFSQLLLLREKGGYKVKPLRTAQSVVKQGSKQPPEKLIIRGASKQLSRQISVRGESPGKRIDPTKRPRRDVREDKSIEKNKFIERKINLRKAEPAESKQKHVISRTASDNIDVLNKRDRSISSTRRGRSVTKNIQVSPRQKSTSTPRRTPSTTEHDKLKSQTKDDDKKPVNKSKNEVKSNSPVTKISTVEKDDFIKAQTPPNMVKRSEIPGNHKLASSLIVPQMVENITSMNQNNDQEGHAKKALAKSTLTVAPNLQETNKQNEYSDEYKPLDKKDSGESGDNKEQTEQSITTEATNDVQKDEDEDTNIDSSCTSSKTGADSSVSNEKDINREATSSTDQSITSTNLSIACDKKEDKKIEETNTEQIEHQIKNEITNEIKKSVGVDHPQNVNSGRTSSKTEKELSISTPSIDETPTENDKKTDEPMETEEKHDDHVNNNTNNTSDGQITNTLTGEASASEILNKNIVDTKQSKNENSSINEIDNKVETDKINQKINKEEIDSSIETQVEEVGNNIIERPANEDVKNLEVQPNEKTLLKTESGELDSKKDSLETSLEQVLEKNVHQQANNQSNFENKIKIDEDNVESVNQYVSGKEKDISDSKEETIKNGNEKDDKSKYPEVVKNEINRGTSVGEKIDKKEGENKDHTIHEKKDIVNQVEEGNKTVSCITKDETEKEHKSSRQSIENNSEHHISEIEKEKEANVQGNGEATLVDTLGDLRLSKVSEGEITEHGENIQKGKIENDNKNSDTNAIEIGNMASEMITADNKNNIYIEEKAKGISKSDVKPHHATDNSSSNKKRDDDNSFKNQGKTSENEAKLENEMEKLEHKESSNDIEELTSHRNSINLKENSENKIGTDKEHTKGALEENFDDNNKNRLSQQGNKINVIKKSDKIETENRKEDDNNKEKDADIEIDNIIKEDNSMKGNNENEIGETKTILVKPDNITKNNELTENKTENKSEEIELNNEERIIAEIKSLKTESTDLIGNVHSNKEDSDEKQAQKQKKETTIRAVDHKADDNNVERINESGNINASEMPVEKQEITDLAETKSPNKNSKEERSGRSIDLGEDKDEISNMTEKVDGDNLLTTDQNILKPGESKNHDPNADETVNTIGDIETKSFIDLKNIDKTAIQSQSEGNESELQKHGSNSVENIIKSVINVVEEGSVDHVVKKCIGDFIQGEQQHVFVDNSNSLDSNKTINKAKEPVEIEEHVLAETTEKLFEVNSDDSKLESPKVEDDKDKAPNRNDVTVTATVEEIPKAHINDVIGDSIQGEQLHVDNSESLESKETSSKVKDSVEIDANVLAKTTEKLTKSNNEDNKLESLKVEDDKDRILNKNDVMKNIMNSTISLAQTGTVDEILKAHINDFIGNEKSNVFAEHIEKDNVSNIAKCDQKQITPNNNESEIKDAKHSLVEASNKDKPEAAVRRLSSKNEPEPNFQKMKQSTKNINSRSSSQASIKGPGDNSKQNNKTKPEKKLRRVKTVDVIKDENKPKIEVKSRIPTADYRNRIKRETDNGKHSILIKPSSQEAHNKLPEKGAGAIKKNDKIIDSAIETKHDDNLNGAIENKRYDEVEGQQNSKDLKETENLAQTSAFDNSKLRDELKAIENGSKLTTFKPTFNPYVLRQEIKNASLSNDKEAIDTKGPNNALTEIAAALKIQSVWRGFKVRKNRATIPPQQKSEIIEEKGSQLVLQDDIKLKENYTDVKSDITDDAAIENANKETKSNLNIINKPENNSRSTERKVNADANRNQQVIQHLKLENDIADSNKIYDDKFIQAAVMIQKIWRAFKVRKDINQKYLENKSSQQNKQEHKVNNKIDTETSMDTVKIPSHELKEFDIVNEKFTAAAVMIQKLWRGFKIRKNNTENCEEKHDEKLEKKTDTLLSKEAQEQRGIEPAEPKVKLQQSRDIFLMTDDKFKKAAITIQKIWRGFIGRKHFKENNKQGNDNKAQQAKTVDCSVTLNKEDKKEVIGELEAVNKKVVENLKSDPPSHSSIEFADLINDQRFKKAAIKIQAVWRGFKVRRVLKDNSKQDAVRDQRGDQQNTKNGNQLMHINLKNDNKTSDVSSERSETKFEKQSENLEPTNDEFVKAAIKIQKIWRGFKVRKISKKGNLFGTRVETEKPVIESVKTEEEIQPKDKKSALKIQSLWRGYQVRKNINIIKDKLEDKMTANDASKEREISDKDILNAATKIQAGFRGYLQRRRYKRDIHNLNSIMEEDIDDKNDIKREETVGADIKSLPQKNTEVLEEKKSSGNRQLSDDEVLKALNGLNKIEIPSDIPSINKINKPTFVRSQTVQESEVIKKQSSPLLKTISYSNINDTEGNKVIHNTNQFTENSKDSNNNSKFAHLEVELKDAIQNITKTNEQEPLSATMPLSNEEVKTTSTNIETPFKTLNRNDTEKIESNDESYLDQEHQQENIHSNVESNIQRENMDVTENGLNNSSDQSLLTNKTNQIQPVSSDENMCAGTTKLDDSEKQVTNNKNNTSENITISQKPKDESKNENNHVSPSLHKLPLTNSASNNNENFLTQSLLLDKGTHEAAENNTNINTSGLKFNEPNEKTVHEGPQGSTNTTSDITSSELDTVRNALPNDESQSKVTDENSTYDRPLSIDSTDSAITVINNNELPRDIDEDNDHLANDGQETNNLPDDINTLVSDDKVKDTLIDHENLINDFQNKLLDQISGKNGDKAPVEDPNNKFNIEALRKELEEAGLIYNTENTAHMQHQNSKEESNVHDQLLEYLHSMDSEEDAESATSEILNLSSRDLPDIKEEDTDAKVEDNNQQKIRNVTNTDVKGNIPKDNIDIEKIQSTLKECEDIAQEINKGIKITETEQVDPTASTENQISEKQLNNDANDNGTVFCKIPKEDISQEKYIDNRPISDHIELINMNKNIDMAKDTDRNVTDNKLVEADDMPAGLSYHKESVETNSDSGTGLAHTGELHDSFLGSLSLTSETDSQELDSLENISTEVPIQDATQNSKLLHTGELHDIVVVPLPLKIQNELKPKLEKEGGAVLQNIKHSDTVQVPVIPSPTEDASAGVPSDKHNTKLLHTGELHDTVVLPLSMHGLEVLNEQQEISQSKSTETSMLSSGTKLTEPVQHNLTPNEPQNQSSVHTYAGLLHTGELHDTVALPLSMHGLEVSNEQQEISHSKSTEVSASPLKAELTESIQQNPATTESLNLNQSTVPAYTGLLHTGELHDAMVLPLSIQALHGLGTSNEQELSKLKSIDSSVLPSEAELTEPIQHNITKNESPNQSSVPAHTGFLHTGELHDTVISPLSIEAMHSLISNEQQEVSHSKSTETSNAELTEPIQQKLLTNVSMSQPTAPQYTGLLHSGELHDTVVVPLPTVNQNTMGIEVTQSGSPRSEGTPRQVDSECQTTGEVHAVPIAVQLNQAPAGVAVLTSPPSISAVHGVSSVQDDIAQAPDKGALPIESGSDFSSPSDSQSMESENRKNATNNNKSMEVEAATKIQAGFRGYQVRKQLKLKNGSSDINNQRRSARRKSSGRITDNGRITQNKAKEPNDIEEKSAVKIQAGVRGFLVRRRQKKQKTQEN